MTETERLQNEVDRLRGQLIGHGQILWALVKSAGGQLRITPEAMEDFHPGVQLARWQDFETNEIVYGTND